MMQEVFNFFVANFFSKHSSQTDATNLIIEIVSPTPQ